MRTDTPAIITPVQRRYSGVTLFSLLLKPLRKYTDCGLMCSVQSVHQSLVSFSLLFHAMMHFHVEFSIPHHSLSQLMI